MVRGLFASAAFLTIPLAVGCQHDVHSAFPPGLEPIDDVTVPGPGGATSDDPYPEAVNIVTGSDDISPYGHATGYVHGSVSDVWAAMKDPGVVADRHHVDSWTAVENVETGYDVSFRTDYTVNNIVTVKFSLTWREGVTEGTEDAPTGVSVVYKKTDGSSFVNLMAGSIELSSLNDTTTELKFAARLDASQTGESNISGWMSDMFNSVVARVHGQPLP